MSDKEILEAMLREDWSNEACEGYVMAAMDRVGVDSKVQLKVLEALHELLDFMGVDDAKEYYREQVDM